MSRGVDDLEDGGRGDGLFEEVEGVLVAVVPIEELVLAYEFVKWVRDVGEAADEGTVFYVRGSKGAFAELGVKFLLSEDGEDFAKVLKVRLEGGAIDKGIIKVDGDTYFEEVDEDVIHDGLECGRGVGGVGWVEVIVNGVETGFDWGRTVDDSVTAGVVVVGGGVTMVEVVVDEGGGVEDVLAERAVDAEAEDGGRVVAPEMVEIDVLMSAMDEWMDVTMRRSVARSMAASGVGVCPPARLRAMSSTESVRMSDISMLDDWAMVGEEAMVAAAEELAADEVEAAAAEAASAAAR
ncbi:hypothetical protein CBR_g12150 [Chara braunii]|uniref:Uncharacterized protein n=1 Tax=Chara braunii TaxID=69332 RepID=A0A388KRB9_CHABU|nr:hypothetical protein CBR_g12150 [Chara braunii]|eukprot:GBG72579.1 hypothetical protein CBR_g12150 [Chara braunii]